MMNSPKLPTDFIRFPVVLLGMFCHFLFAADARSQVAQHWSFRPLIRPAVPKVNDGGEVQSPLDAFILARLQAGKIHFSPEADRTTLMRRVFFDLHGLPPMPEEREAFLKDDRPDAYPRLLDRLLASPAFGERWGRHWLDNAGYVDVTGTDNDAGTIRMHENRWRYRDWVIRSMNADLPFDRFMMEQLAGDSLVDWRSADRYTPAIVDSLIATGFLRTAADDTEENELNTLDIRYGVLHRTIEMVASNLLGVTLGCAKCHDHVYEPITQKDYYGFQAIFQPAFNPDRWLQPKNRQIPEISAADKSRFEKNNTDLQKRLGELKKREAALGKSADKKDLEDIALQVGELNRQIKKWGHLQAVYDVGPPTPTYLLKRGNHDRPGEEVAPDFPRILKTTSFGQFSFTEKSAGEKTAGRRKILADWLNHAGSPANGLLIRVRVNRIWQQLFGVGIVASGDNLGVSGVAPTHPELLDWLACSFLEDGQRLKPFLKRIMLSRVYRQTSRPREAVPGNEKNPPVVDPENKLLWRMRLRRLESEAVRDAILAVSGKLDRTVGGPPVAVESRPDGAFVVSNKEGRFRRSVYLLARRNYHPTILGVFDQPNLVTNCLGRGNSAVVSQTLTLLNDPFVLEQAGFVAERVLGAVGKDRKAGFDFAMKLTLGRSPQPREQMLAEAFFQRQVDQFLAMKLTEEVAHRRALVHLCHMLLNTNEFLYIG